MNTVLVVEHDVNQASLYAEELEESGFAVIGVSCGADSLSLLAQITPDVVLFDIAVPIEDMEFVRSIRKTWPRLPVVLQTAYACHQSEFARQAGSVCLLKSSDLSQLKTHIQEAVESSVLASHDAE